MDDGPVLYDSHMHTPLCKHARGEPEEYAWVAQQRGLKGIVFTCHNPIDDGLSAGVRMDLAELDTYVEMVARARGAWEGEVDVRLGIESDYAPGMEPWLERLHGMAEFHHVLGSVHPHLLYYQEGYFDGDILNYQHTYFEHLAMAAETGLFDTVAHPDLVKNSAPSEWDPERIMDVIRQCLDRIAATDTAMELNTSGMHKRVSEMNPGPLILAGMRRRDIPVVLGSDAHVPEHVAAAFEEALDRLVAAGYTQVDTVVDRKRTALPIAIARKSLRGV